MPIGTPYGAELPTHAHSDPEESCAFVLEGDTSTAAGRRCCGVPRRLGSPYCHEHHALCHLPARSLAEQHKLNEIEALAKAVGGRSGRPARRPSPRFLQRMDRISRAALRPEGSCFVLIDRDTRGGAP